MRSQLTFIWLITIFSLSACTAAMSEMAPTATITNVPSPEATGGPRTTPAYASTQFALATATANQMQLEVLSNFRLFFQSYEEGCNVDISAANADGTSHVRLTYSPGMGYELISWSPDGSKLLLTVFQNDDQDIYVMNSDGSGLTNLTNTLDYDEEDPAWSPDSSQITFARFRRIDQYNFTYDLYVMNADGSEISKPLVEGLRPAWSPDGNWIAFEAISDNGETSQKHIHLMRPDGTGISAPLAEGSRPAWSPDGSRIAFWSNGGISVINPDGSNLTLLSDQVEHNIYLSSVFSWSPDGNYIAFNSSLTQNSDIYILKSDGSNLVNLTNHPADDVSPAWSPDSQFVAFTRLSGDSSMRDAVYIVNLDGSGLRRISSIDVHTESPLWYPFASPPYLVVPPSPTPAVFTVEQMLADFPLEVGLERVYEVTIEYRVGYDTETNTLLTETWTGKVTERITDSYWEGDTLVFSVEFEDYPSLGADGPEVSTEKMEYRLIGNSLFLEWQEILQWPLVEGRSWPLDEDLADHNACWYMWLIQSKQDVTTRLGHYKDCFFVGVWTRPDHTYNFFCPGVGLVSKDYVHHGGGDDMRHWELISIKRP